MVGNTPGLKRHCSNAHTAAASNDLLPVLRIILTLRSSPVLTWTYNLNMPEPVMPRCRAESGYTGFGAAIVDCRTCSAVRYGPAEAPAATSMTAAAPTAKMCHVLIRLTRKRTEPAGSGATWTGSPKGGFSGRKHHKPRLALNSNTAGVCEREDANRTRVAGHLDEIQGVVASTRNSHRNGAVGFIDWLDRTATTLSKISSPQCRVAYHARRTARSPERPWAQKCKRSQRSRNARGQPP
jgi:hypothetical protein